MQVEFAGWRMRGGMGRVGRGWEGARFCGWRVCGLAGMEGLEKECMWDIMRCHLALSVQIKRAVSWLDTAGEEGVAWSRATDKAQGARQKDR